MVILRIQWLYSCKKQLAEGECFSYYDSQKGYKQLAAKDSLAIRFMDTLSISQSDFLLLEPRTKVKKAPLMAKIEMNFKWH